MMTESSCWLHSLNHRTNTNFGGTMKVIKFFSLLAVLFSFAAPTFAQLKDAPAPLTTALFVKVIGFEKQISKNQATIYVLGSSELAAELKKAVGHSKIKNVQSGNSLPKTKPSVLFICDPKLMAEAIEYTHENKVMSATNIPSLVIKGITLGFGIGTDSKPKVLLNLSASSREGCDWDSTVLALVTLDFP
jgi:hypothetical protein